MLSEFSLESFAVINIFISYTRQVSRSLALTSRPTSYFQWLWIAAVFHITSNEYSKIIICTTGQRRLNDKLISCRVTMVFKVTHYNFFQSPLAVILMSKVKSSSQLPVCVISTVTFKNACIRACGAPCNPSASLVSSVFAARNLFPLITIDLQGDKVFGRDSLACLI